MKQYLIDAKNFIIKYKDIFIVGGTGVLVVIAIVIGISLLVENSKIKIVYQPATACNLFTLDEAKELLGGRAVNSSTGDPIQDENYTVSRCGYTDGNPDTSQMGVIAIIARSGINDKGIKQNQDEFAAGLPTQQVEIVKDLGDRAYFNVESGQLNVLDGRDWIVFSYGFAATPGNNTIEQATELARKTLRSSPKD